MLICTTPWRSFSVTLPTSPICTPVTWTLSPWPGVTAWAVANDALIVSGDDSQGNLSRSLERM